MSGAIAALVASLIYAIVNTLLTAIFSISSDDSYWAILMQQLAGKREGVIRSDKPGLVVVQIDGLAHPILARQVRAGRVPHLSGWLRSGKYMLSQWEALLPSQTSASQAGILHGNNDGIPAFRWYEKESGRTMVSNHPVDATEIVRRVSNGEGLLSNDGASVGNLVTGDAVRSYITMASIKDKSQGLGKSQTFMSFFASPYNYLGTIVRSIGEIGKEYIQARRQERAGIVPRMHRGMPYPVARAATNVALRDLSTSLVIEEMYRGTPVIYVDYTDYDEIAHHSGPERGETFDALDGVDRAIATLEKASAAAPRPVPLRRRLRPRPDAWGRRSSSATARRSATSSASSWAATPTVDGGGGARRGVGPDERLPLRADAGQGRLRAAGPDGPAVPDQRRRRRARAVRRGGCRARPRRDRRRARSARTSSRWPRATSASSTSRACPAGSRSRQLAETYPGLVDRLAAHPGIGAILIRSAEHGAHRRRPRGDQLPRRGPRRGRRPGRPVRRPRPPGLRPARRDGAHARTSP